MARPRKAAEAPLGLTATLERAALFGALQAVIKTVEAKSPTAAHTHLKIASTAFGVAISGTDTQIETVANVQVEVESPGVVTVPAQKFLEIVREAPATAQVRIEQGDNLTTIIRAGRSRFVLPGLDPVTYAAMPLPVDDDGREAVRVEIPGDVLAAGIAEVSYAMSAPEEPRAFLTGIHLHPVLAGSDGDHLIMVASDGLQIARHDLGPVEGVAAMGPIIIPGKTAALIAKLAEIAGDGPVRLAFSRSLIRAESGDVALISRLIDGVFPEYERAIPRENPIRLRIARAEMKTAVKRVALMTASVVDRSIALEITPGKIAISTRDGSGGEGSDEVDAEYEGAKVRIFLSPQRLMSALSAMSVDTLTLAIRGPGDAILMEAGDDLPAAHVLAGMKA